jgi:preprotein translocase subunit YajC
MILKAFYSATAALLADTVAPAVNPFGELGRVAVPMGLMMFGLYFVMIRPQQKKAKEHESLLKTLKSGDRVATSGGLLGVVITVKDKTVTLRCADSKLEIQKAAVTEVLERESQGAEKQS